MYDFRYVSKSELTPLKRELIELINLVQKEVREQFTFQYEFVGSVKRNMVTCDVKSNIGFDFDINLMVNNDDEEYRPKKIKHILMKAFNKFVGKYRYDSCEDSTRVFTIKVKDKHNSRILHSCDFAIINNCGDYIKFNKKENEYIWEEQPEGFYCLPEKIKFCKDNFLWLEVRKIYIEKKNCNTDKNKKSRSIFAETIHQVCQKNGYFDKTVKKGEWRWV